MANEQCGGSYGNLGRCEENLQCSADEDLFLNGTNISGTCHKSKMTGLREIFLHEGNMYYYHW